MPDVRRHPQFVAWTDAVVHADRDEYLGEDSRTIRRQIEALIARLGASDGPLAMPLSSPIRGVALDLHELRWPSEPRGRGPGPMSEMPVVRVVYGYATAPSRPDAVDICVILLGGDKSSEPTQWYGRNVPAALRRLGDWCSEHPPYEPRGSIE